MKNSIKRLLTLLIALFCSIFPMFSQDANNEILKKVFLGEEFQANKIVRTNKTIEVYCDNYDVWNKICNSDEITFIGDKDCDIKLLQFDKIGDTFLIHVTIKDRSIKYIFRMVANRIIKYRVKQFDL